jgi:hypothetical protein
MIIVEDLFISLRLEDVRVIYTALRIVRAQYHYHNIIVYERLR